MPSGKTHDRITWLTALPVMGGGWFITQDLRALACLGGAFLFAGLMFSGDLDTKSVQYKRWGWFRWIWIPYRKLVPHRSPFSHGPVLGVLTRLVYLSLWVMLLFFSLTRLALAFNQNRLVEQGVGLAEVFAGMMTHPVYAVMGLAGLWLGGFSHTLADEFVSLLKRIKRRKFARRGAKKRKRA
ncbi:metal-binding protein [bacterium (Candidatus Blackallbacteria) CG17_big_fil_post_rev_8_21_14_2_50_48_46]|uniref:Metal-binding protein n=1 Tax=bacterium (Candidatus Blackallbacteria) CG17_big_fil_post_rev_8_21_14_2_50_48_46 TaxID=2014261 RepID=A0A2M7FXU1_9BACT|nr:MAG: metal-binding protein [bacterium (Candidatus Blackallbacteria) CG18_big_fil_WC_8_21_14_2_50_49_26]PIW14121.1 MAG: metal-binding protein [bacterium (Candidatus Blackallbacteria) CG17_big_fil_post_rev_8_21_14_2_50_48_46]PIW45851.1 MAG: metal-binding protein [bacterium (Candidatus Blackallbacteria) CG13_big_fil_rev_8_21_14_2_50_49_14]